MLSAAKTSTRVAESVRGGKRPSRVDQRKNEAPPPDWTVPVVVEHVQHAEDYKACLAARGAWRVPVGVRSPRVFAFVRGRGKVEIYVGASMGSWTAANGLVRGDSLTMMQKPPNWDPILCGNYWGAPFDKPGLEPLKEEATNADYYEQEFDKFLAVDRGGNFFNSREISAYRSYLNCMREREKGNLGPREWEWLDHLPVPEAPGADGVDEDANELSWEEMRARIAKLTSEAYLGKHLPTLKIPEFVRGKQQGLDIPTKPILLRKGLGAHLKPPYTASALTETWRASSFALVDGPSVTLAAGERKCFGRVQLVRINHAAPDGRVLVSRYGVFQESPHVLLPGDGLIFHYHAERGERPVWLKMKCFWVWGFEACGLTTKCYIPSEALFALAGQMEHGGHPERAEVFRKTVTRVFTK